MKFKHKARGVEPRIVELADELGIRLYRRDGELWGNGDVQLTYRHRTIDGKQVPLDDIARFALAVELLQSIKDARAKWGTIRQRWRIILRGLRSAVPKYRRDTYTSYRHPSLDEGWMFASQYEPKWEMGMDLVGCERQRADGATPEACLKALEALGPPALREEKP